MLYNRSRFAAAWGSPVISSRQCELFARLPIDFLAINKKVK